jgi:hypothetical protein
MVRGLHALLSTPPHADPEAVIRRQLANREQVWMDLVRRVVFSNPENPYHQMFDWAGCTYEDLKAGLERDGLEATLAVLHRAGVYLSHDEFKGKKPIVRGNRTIESGTASFHNPLVKGGMESTSGGSRSAGTKTFRGVPARLYGEARRWLRVREFGVQDREHVTVKAVLPAADGLMGCVVQSRMGLRAGPWFSTMTASLDAAHYRFATNCLVTLARLYGERVPYPVSLPADDYSPVSAWIGRRRREGVLSLVATYPSPGARVAAAALEKGHDIRDTIFFVGGEALTAARRRVIESAGAQVYPSYPISEIGGIGWACRQMTSGNSVHIAEDAMGVISYRRRAALTEVEVDSLLFTTLLEHGASVVINVEMDDCGVIEPATCDCTFSKMGFRRRIRDIASFGKLTGIGVTLVGTDVVRVLEEALPARFGGGVTDYQLVEQDGDIQAKLELRVSRRVKLDSLDEVRVFFLRELRQFEGGAGASRIWRDTAALQVVHEDPLVTSRGKVLPLHLMGSGMGSRT